MLTELEGYDIFNSFKTRNWIRYYLIEINFLMDETLNTKDLPDDLINLKDSNGKEIDGSIKMFKNTSLVNNNIITEIYYVFYEFIPPKFL